MTRRILVVGGGAVGVRTVRDLVAHESAHVVLATRRPDRQRGLEASFPGRVRVIAADTVDPTSVLVGSDEVGPVDAVVLATPGGDHAVRAEAEMRRGHDVVSCSDDPDDVERLLALDARARELGRSIVAGAVFGPGFSCLLATWAVGRFDEVDEVRVARLGAGGPACARRRRRAARGTSLEWRDGWQRSPAFSGRELVWFPDPIGARDCFHAAVPDALLLRDLAPGAARISARLAATRRNRLLDGLPMLLPPPAEGGPGAVRVEVRGRVGERVEELIVGAVDRPASAAAAVAALAAARIGTDAVRTGAAGLGVSALDPAAWLAELHRRGVRAARFEGTGGA